MRTATAARQSDAEQLAGAVDLHSAVERFAGTTAELLTRLKSITDNAVLFSATVILDTAGQWSQSWPVTFAALDVDHHGSGTLTVAGAPAESRAPTNGPGVHTVAAGGHRTINILSNQLTLYGNAGDLVSVQVFTHPQPPTAGAPLPYGATSVGPVAVAQSPATGVLLAANPARKGGLIYNNTTANLYIAFGPTCSTSLFTEVIGTGQALDLSGQAIYVGVISGIWDAAGIGDALITELV